MIDATYIKAHCTAASLRQKKRGVDYRIRRTKDGLTLKLDAVCNGKPLILLMAQDQMSDYKGAVLVLDARLPCQGFSRRPRLWQQLVLRCLGGKGHHTVYSLRWPLAASRKNPNIQIEYDTVAYKKRHKIENMFTKLKDWRRIAMRYDRCAHTAFSSICLSAAFIF